MQSNTKKDNKRAGLFRQRLPHINTNSGTPNKPTPAITPCSNIFSVPEPNTSPAMPSLEEDSPRITSPTSLKSP